MPKEKRKVEDVDESDSSYEGKGWAFAIEWLLVLVLVAAIIFVVMAVMGPLIGNVFSDVIFRDTF